MKKLLVLFGVMVLLAGCSVQTFERVEDQNDVPALATPAQLQLELPEDAAALTMQGNSGTLYFCENYDISVEILPSGNLDSTLRTLTGFGREELNIFQTLRSDADCYEAVWSAAGEAGDQVGRLMVLDDGAFHYCVSLMGSAESAGDHMEEWNAIFASAALTAQ